MIHAAKITRDLALVAIALAMLQGCNCNRNGAQGAQRENGEDCDEDNQCKSLLCDTLPAGKKVCLQRCDLGCGASEVCLNLGLNRWGCAPEREGLCRPCQSDNDCPYNNDRCIAVAGVTQCGRDCSFDGKCPSGYACQNGFTIDGNQVPAQCQPLSGTCACTPATIGQTVPCEHTNSFGTCMGVKTCQQTMYSECMASIPAEELCNGLDDDCDGTVDEGTGVQTCGIGECQRMVPACADGGVAVCTPGMPGTEVCDEKDNDCNTIVDDGWNKQTDLMNCGLCGAVCAPPHATPECAMGMCRILSCDPGWGDCINGVTDGCETDLTTSVMHCGTCGHACNAAHANNSCVAGNCQFMCQAGWVDLDMNPANGCEYQCTYMSATDLPDLAFQDANCDGIDGEVQNGIFVAVSGNDANAGTRAAPKQTINAALAAVVASGKRDVYVAAGTYTDQVSMAAGKGLYGGYLSTTWARATSNVSTVTGNNTPLAVNAADGARVQLMTFIGSTPVGAGETAYAAWVSNSTGVVFEALTLRAGNGTPGSNGVGGSTGASGGTGFTGQPGIEDSSFACHSNSQPQGGAGGVSACGRTGGRGGNAQRNTGTGYNGGAGVGGTGGGFGVPYGRGNSPPATPYVGLDGADGAPGGDGTSAAGFGAASAVGYLVASATAGAVGDHGNGGGGGGGGGGGNNNCDSYGGGGGGGGAGGCGGGEGQPAMSGGASIALFLFDGSVTATGCTLETGNGGNGGAGGTGGSGGMGGAGAVASNGAGNEYGQSDSQDDGSNGGRGGLGGSGGRGGHGGAGGGGPSIGVLKAGASSWTMSSTTIVLGAGGLGGASGAGNGMNGVRAGEYP